MESAHPSGVRTELHDGFSDHLEPTVEEAKKRVRKQPMFDMAFLGPRTREQGIHPMHGLRPEQPFQGNARLAEEHAHITDFCLGDTAQRPLYRGPFLLDTDEVAFRMRLRPLGERDELAHQRE